MTPSPHLTPDEQAQARAYALARVDGLSASAFQLEPAIRLFAKDVAQAGLWDRIHESRQRSMRGSFAGTTLMTWVVAGRVMLTFSSEGGEVTLVGTEDDNSDSIHPIHPVDPVNVYRIDLHSIHCPDRTAISMINTISTQWPPDPVAQRAQFRDDQKVTLDVPAAPRGR